MVKHKKILCHFAAGLFCASVSLVGLLLNPAAGAQLPKAGQQLPNAVPQLPKADRNCPTRYRNYPMLYRNYLMNRDSCLMHHPLLPGVVPECSSSICLLHQFRPPPYVLYQYKDDMPHSVVYVRLTPGKRHSQVAYITIR